MTPYLVLEQFLLHNQIETYECDASNHVVDEPWQVVVRKPLYNWQLLDDVLECCCYLISLCPTV